MSDDAIKAREREFHDHLRGDLQPTGDPKYTAYRKWYAAGSGGREWMMSWLRGHVPGKRVLDYACGSGGTGVEIARMGPMKVVGIDISPRSIAAAKLAAEHEGVNVEFIVMDAERTTFQDETFDIVVCSGVLHHMELGRAYPEIARVLKPNGHVIALEALGHNPLINWYRRRTPYLRSPDEHPLLVGDLALARQSFREVDVRYFSLLALLAAPFWRTRLLGPLKTLLVAADRVLLRVPFVQRQAWMAGMVMRAPVKRGASEAGT